MAQKEICGLFCVGGREIKYRVVFTAKKNIILRVIAADEVRISMPPRVLRPKKRAEEFLRQNEARIMSLFEKYISASTSREEIATTLNDTKAPDMELFAARCNELNLRCYREFSEAGYKVPLAKITLKSMKSRWGSCTAVKGKISINSRLAKLPPLALESVFYHEYSHFAEQNHSKNFYAVLDKMFPKRKEAEKLLKSHSALNLP